MSRLGGRAGMLLRTRVHLVAAPDETKMLASFPCDCADALLTGPPRLQAMVAQASVAKGRPREALPPTAQWLASPAAVLYTL